MIVNMKKLIPENTAGRIRRDKAATHPFCALAAVLMLFVLLVSMVSCNSGSPAAVYSDTGKTETELMVRLGIYSSVTGADVNAKISRFDAALSLEKLTGAGNENRAADFFRMISYPGTVDLMTDPDGRQAEAEEKVSSYQAYSMCLKALGYGEAAAQVENADGLYELASNTGFGKGSGIIKTNELTVGEYAVILSEFAVLRPNNATDAVYRILSTMDPDYCLLLKNNGLYDDVPLSLCPAFNYGIYVTGSFSEAAYDDKSEWTASYYATEEEVSVYEELLRGSGWAKEGQYSSETEPGTVILLYYKAIETAHDGEAGIVLKYSADGLLSWNLLA